MHCKHFGTCGGCSLPGVPYAEQLAQKRTRLSALLGMPVPPLVPSPQVAGFRQKVAFVFGQAGPRLVMGHYARGTQRVVPVDECPVHGDRGNRIAFALRDRLARARVPAAGASRGGILRHIIIRTTQDQSQAVAMLVVTRNDKSLRTPVRGLLDSPDRPDGFFINIHDRPGPFMVGPETIKIDGHGHVKEYLRRRSGHTRIGDRGSGIGPTAFLVSPTAFFQTNVGAAEVLQELVLDSLQDAARVLDLYSGSGLFALALAQAGATVTAVEENRQAIKDLEANLRLNHIADGRVRAVCARVEEVLPRVAREPWDAVILDPPRDGCSPEVLSGIFERMAPRRVVYVSCQPEALARELPFILKAGYRVVQAKAVDMFPHTDHIETVLTLSRP